MIIASPVKRASQERVDCGCKMRVYTTLQFICLHQNRLVTALQFTLYLFNTHEMECRPSWEEVVASHWKCLLDTEKLSYELESHAENHQEIRRRSQFKIACLLSKLDQQKQLLRSALMSGSGATEQNSDSQITLVSPQCARVAENHRESVADLKSEVHGLIRLDTASSESVQSLKLEYKDGKWVRTYEGCDLEDDQGFETPLSRLKRNFDRQCCNILILESERNDLSVQLASLQQSMALCTCNKPQSTGKSLL